MIDKLDDMNIDRWINSDKALYILFSTDDMPNTVNVKEIFKNFDIKFTGKIQILFCEINGANCENLRKRFQMKTLPAVLFMKKGKVYGNMAGPTSITSYEDIAKHALMEMIKEQNPN